MVLELLAIRHELPLASVFISVQVSAGFLEVFNLDPGLLLRLLALLDVMIKVGVFQLQLLSQLLYTFRALIDLLRL